MNRADWQEVERVLAAVMELPATERFIRVAQLCADRPQIRVEVESLLAASEKVDTFLQVETQAGADAASASSLQGRQLGPYRLLGILGAGGMGTVYRAERSDGRFQKQVAVKLVPSALHSPELLRRFAGEQQILAALEHPNIARLLDAGVSPEGIPFFVMEYVEGVPVNEYCDARGLSTKDRLRLFQNICSAAQYAHQHLVVHRDLKPANILVSSDGVAKLLDFGIAKIVDPWGAGNLEVTRSLLNPMTPAYASPEQIRGETLTTATDVYSLGVVLYELLTGQLPYRVTGKPFDEAIRIISESEPEKPSAVARRRDAGGHRAGRSAPELSSDLDAIVAKAMRKDPHQRYASAQEVSADLTRYLDGLPVLAHRGSFRYRAIKFTRRHRFGVAASLAVMALLLGFAATMAVQARRIAVERDRANREAETSRRVSDFMTNMFKVSDPSEARGNSITAREILDKASKDIEGGLAKDPEVQAHMMDVIGNIYDNLGLYPTAESLFKRSLGVRRKVLGTRNADTLETMTDLGWVLEEQGSYEDAEKLVRETLETRRQLLGPKHPDTLKSMIRLAEILNDEGRYPEAEKLARQALQMHSQVLGPDHANTLAAMDTLAFSLGEQGRYYDAEKLYRHTLDASSRSLGFEHQLTLNRMGDVAWVLEQEGRYSDAERQNRQVLDIERRILGTEHPNTLNTEHNLAETILQQGRFAEAENIYRETSRIRSRVLGPEHPDTLNSQVGLALALTRQGKNVEAEKLARESLASQQRVIGAEHLDTAGSMATLARILANERRYVEAERMARHGLDTSRRAVGPDHRQTLACQGDLADILAHQGKFAEAEELLRAAIEVQSRSLGTGHPDTATSKYQLAGLLARQGRRDEGLSTLQDAVDHGLPSGTHLDINQEEDFKSLHGDPRFDALVAHAKQRAATAQKGQ